jgi:hypothetical protein
MTYKKIKIIRGGAIKPLVREKDTFDSVLYVDDGKKITMINHVNTDFCNGYNGGILAEGHYAGVFMERADNKRLCFKLINYNDIDLVQDGGQISEAMRVFPSLIPNPNQGGDHVITQVLIHQDGYQGGWSHGCITIYYDDWEQFVKFFHLGEIVEIELTRFAGWVAPKFYQGC